MAEPSPASQTLCVLGAGPSGIAAAYFAQKLGFQVLLVEEKTWVGGKGASREVDNYIFDFGPHAYHPKTEAINELVLTHSGNDYLLTEAKMELILRGKRMGYPLSLKEALLRFHPLFSLKMLADYMWVKVINKIKELPEDSFRDWGVKHFGRSLYELCFGAYTERVWKLEAQKLSVELARRKLPRFSIRGMLSDMLFGRGKMHEHILTNKLGYHRKGIGKIYENIVEGIVSRGGQLFTETRAARIRSDSNSNGFSIELDGSAKTSLGCDYIISTIPVTSLLSTLALDAENFSGFSSRVEFRRILLVYAVIDLPQFSAAHWTYLVDGRFNFHRISEQKNLSADCAPQAKTVITLEISCGEEDPMWQWSGEAFRKMVNEDLGYFGLQPQQISKLYVSQLKDAYPVYAIDFEKEMESVLGELATVPNLITTGRQGLFLDIDMHDAMALGKTAVEALMNQSVKEFYKAACNRVRGKA